MFSKACEYAIRASIYIAAKSQKGLRVGISDVAQKIESPVAFTSKILQKLVKIGVIQSIKGPGGFYIESDRLEEIKIATIVEEFDGDVLNRCSIGLNECSDDQPCPFHAKYKPVKEKLQHIFGNTSLKDLTRGFLNDTTFLRI
ncbi:MAG: Rrf2 family transcriptional regulator [Saprospiraceae bacterium]|nr:Rrf2 family transcriptional regulator [Candidatus Vicinibacter affinis]